MAVAVAGGGQEPDYIKYLMDPNKEYDCYFIVTNPESEMNEKIGGVKKMLMAHSEVLRTELEESQLAMKTDIRVCDLFSDTLRQLLKYIYGYDVTASMCFDDADNLLYAAEKYMITSLKDKLVFRLMNLVTSDNVCSLLNNPVCYKPLQLKNTISKILQYETDKVLQNPQFLHLSSEAFLKILEQDAMNVPEIEVWRAAVKWAKHKAASEDGQVLRQELTSHVKHIRFCALTAEEICNEVIPTHVLKDAEAILVCKSVGLKTIQTGLTEICDEMKPRTKLTARTVLLEMAFSDIFVNNNNGTRFLRFTQEPSFTMITKNWDLELSCFECMLSKSSTSVSCTVTITQVIDCLNDALVISVEHNDLPTNGREFLVPLTLDGKNISLLRHSQYRVTMKFTQKVLALYTQKATNEFDSVLIRYWRNTKNDTYFCPITRMLFRAVT